MKFYKVEESGNYCGYDEEYLIKSDKGYNAVDDFCCEHADDRSMEEGDWEVEDDEEELHISYTLEEISEEEFIKFVEEDCLEVEEVQTYVIS